MVDYKYSSIREALGKEPLFFLDEDIVRLIGEDENSKKEYERFIVKGENKDLGDIEK